MGGQGDGDAAEMNPDPHSATQTADFALEELEFWLWGFLQDAEAYLATSERRRNLPFRSAERGPLRQLQRLQEYHLLTCASQLSRHVDHVASLNPRVKAASLGAEHLLQEARWLRNMIEHLEKYYAGKGDFQADFVKTGIVMAGAAADASSTFIVDEAHWLGGRFHLERGIAEARVIEAAVRSALQDDPSDPNPSAAVP
jgi:hypothetical protein